MQIEVIRADRARELPVDEFLIGGDCIDGKIKYDNRAGTLFRRRPQCEIGPSCQLATRSCMPWRLRKTCMRAHPHEGIDPIRARDSLNCVANDGPGIFVCGHHDGKFVSGDAPADNAHGKRFPQPPGNRDDKLVTPQNAMRGGHVIHAVELDQREGRAFIIGPLGKREIQKLEARIKVNIVLVPNPHLETPHYKVQRLKHDELNQMEHVPTSYELVEPASAEDVARTIVRCVISPKAEVYPLRKAWWLSVLGAVAPARADRVVQRFGRRRQHARAGADGASRS